MFQATVQWYVQHAAGEDFLDTLGAENGLLYRGFHYLEVILHA